MLSTEELLHLLKKNAERHVSGEELSEALGVSRTAVWKHIQHLEAAGYEIQAVPHLGYRLVSAPDRLLPEEIRSQLSTRLLGRILRCFQETTSTNDRALEMAAAGAPEGTLVAAENQSAGRGRRERKWLSKPDANLLFSIVFRPPWIAEQAPFITLMMAVAVAESIRRQTGLEAEIKWPNDILVAGAKVAGILTEMKAEADAVDYIVCGIGINVNAFPGGASLRQPATSLAKCCGRPLPRLPLLRECLQQAEALYTRALSGGRQDILTEWQNLSRTVGSQGCVELASGERWEGMVMGVDESGALLLRQDNGITRRVTSGELRLVHDKARSRGAGDR